MKFLSCLLFLLVSITDCTSMQLTIFNQSSLLDHKEDMEDAKQSFHEVYKNFSENLRNQFFKKIIKMSTSIVIAKSGLDSKHVATVFYGFDEPDFTKMLFMFTYAPQKRDEEIQQALYQILEHIKNSYKKMIIECLILQDANSRCTDFIKHIGFEYQTTEDPGGEYGGWHEYKLSIDDSAINNNN